MTIPPEITENTVVLSGCALCGGYHGSWEAHLPPPASRQEAGALEAVLTAAPDSCWKAVSTMRDYLASRGVRVAVRFEESVGPTDFAPELAVAVKGLREALDERNFVSTDPELLPLILRVVYAAEQVSRKLAKRTSRRTA